MSHVYDECAFSISYQLHLLDVHQKKLWMSLILLRNKNFMCKMRYFFVKCQNFYHISFLIFVSFNLILSIKYYGLFLHARSYTHLEDIKKWENWIKRIEIKFDIMLLCKLPLPYDTVKIYQFLMYISAELNVHISSLTKNVGSFS